MRILYKLATRARAHKIFNVLDNITSMARHDDYHILITADTDDETMFNKEVNERINAYPNTTVLYGTSTSKVNAINRDMQLYTDWDILINMSDDMEFIMPGFDTAILNDYAKFPVGDVFLHYPDQAAGAALCTMSIMDKQYYDRDGYIYHPDYKSLFCDNEAQEVAKLRGRYIFIKRRLFNHNHPAWGLAPMDALMVHTESFHLEDKATFERRKSINFGL